jgi:hydroxymethylpyrimidine pyrophosphatase-like HAD family hydrolase
MFIIFSDVDGTLYGPENNLDSRTLKDINTAQAEGVVFALCTGNAPHIYMKEVGAKTRAKYLINSNGASIINLETKEVLFKNLISAKKANKILVIANELKLGGD